MLKVQYQGWSESVNRFVGLTIVKDKSMFSMSGDLSSLPTKQEWMGSSDALPSPFGEQYPLPRISGLPSD
jgi:hypothetical protein